MTRRLTILLSAASVVSAIAFLFIYGSLPATMPIHWNSAGQVDNTGPRWVYLILQAVPLLIALGMYLVPRLDPRRANYQRHSKAYSAFAIVLTLSFILISWISALAALGYPLAISRLVPILVGVILIVVGNFMPQLRSSFFVGIRTPWALENDEVWRRTHRAGGVMFCLFGLAFIAAAFIPGALAFWLPIGFTLVGLAGVYLYSYLCYRKLGGGHQA